MNQWAVVSSCVTCKCLYHSKAKWSPKLLKHCVLSASDEPVIFKASTPYEYWTWIPLGNMHHLSRLDSTGLSHGRHKLEKGPVQIFMEQVEISRVDVLDDLRPWISVSSRPQRLIKLNGCVCCQWAACNMKAGMFLWTSVCCTFHSPASESEVLVVDIGQKDTMMVLPSCLCLIFFRVHEGFEDAACM